MSAFDVSDFLTPCITLHLLLLDKCALPVWALTAPKSGPKDLRLSSLWLSVFPHWAADHLPLTSILPVTKVTATLLTVHQLGDSKATFSKCQL